MGTRLRLRVGWTRNWISTPDPRHRFDARHQPKLDLKAIRIQFDGLAVRFGVQTSETDRAVGSIGNTISELVYEVETALDNEIDRLDDAA